MENINSGILNIRSTSFGLLQIFKTLLWFSLNWQACEIFTYLGQNGEEMHYWMIEIQIWQLNICMRVKSCSETSLAALTRSWKVFTSSVPSGIFIYIPELFIVLGVAFSCKEGYIESDSFYTNALWNSLPVRNVAGVQKAACSVHVIQPREEGSAHGKTEKEEF